MKVFGTINYETQVVHDDDLPNKKYVDDSILNNPTFQIVAPQSQDTRVIITDKEITPNINIADGIALAKNSVLSLADCFTFFLVLLMPYVKLFHSQ